MSITPLNPVCNYMGIMEQHLKLLAAGEPILKPVYNPLGRHARRSVLVELRDLVIVEGHLRTKLKGCGTAST